TARQAVDARNDVDDAHILMTPGLEVSGQLRVEGQAIPNLGQIHVSLLPPEGSEVWALLPNAQVKQDGSFTLSNVRPDLYDVTALELPNGYYVKSVWVGDNEVLDGSLNLSDSLQPITIVISPGAAEIAGVVENAQQKVAVGALVTLAPLDAKRRGQAQ